MQVGEVEGEEMTEILLGGHRLWVPRGALLAILARRGLEDRILAQRGAREREEGPTKMLPATPTGSRQALRGSRAPCSARSSSLRPVTAGDLVHD